MRAVLSLCAMVTALGAGSSPTAEERPETAAIRGVVLEEGSDRPVAGAWIVLNSFAAPEPAPWENVRPVAPAATSDRGGRFEVNAIKPGAYRLTVVRSGYVRRVFGQRVDRGHATPLNLAEGGTTELTVRLIPTGSVSGAIRDSAGRPVAGAPVRLMRPKYLPSGERGVTDVVTATSDDRGEYRLYWVTPGRYYVQTGSTSWDELTPIESFNQHALRAGNVVRTVHGETYYPGVRDLAQALAVDVRPGLELSGIDITLEPQKRFRIGGQVSDAARGRTGLEGNVFLYLPEALWGRGGFSFEDGAYQVGPVTPGVYWLAFSTNDGSEAKASARVVVVDADVDVAVTLASPSIVKGRVVVDGALAPAKLEDFSLVARPDGDVPMAILFEDWLFTRAEVRADGTFTLPALASSALRVAPGAWPQGFYLKEARLDGVDVLNAAAPFSRASRLDVVISSRGGRIEGTVTGDRTGPAANVQVVLVPDTKRDRVELFKNVETDAAGRFTIAGIAPGDYRLFAWEALELYAWFDPDVLRSYEPMGQPVRVSEASTSSADLRMIPAEGAR